LAGRSAAGLTPDRPDNTRIEPGSRQKRAERSRRKSASNLLASKEQRPMSSASSAQNEPDLGLSRLEHRGVGDAGSRQRQARPTGDGVAQTAAEWHRQTGKLCQSEPKSLIATHCPPEGNVRWLRFCAGVRTRFQSETAIPAPGGAASPVLEETKGKSQRLFGSCNEFGGY
jgi:hypothetical protein